MSWLQTYHNDMDLGKFELPFFFCELITCGPFRFGRVTKVMTVFNTTKDHHIHNIVAMCIDVGWIVFPLRDMRENSFAKREDI